MLGRGSAKRGYRAIGGADGGRQVWCSGGSMQRCLVDSAGREMLCVDKSGTPGRGEEEGKKDGRREDV